MSDATTTGVAANATPPDDKDRIDALLGEVQVRLDEQAARGNALASRAAILVSSTAIAVSLLDISAAEGWVYAATIFAIAAAAFGVYALFPKRGQYADLMVIREDFFNPDTALQDARARLADSKIAFYNDAGGRLKRHSWSLRLGYLALAVGILCAGIGTIVGG